MTELRWFRCFTVLTACRRYLMMKSRTRAGFGPWPTPSHVTLSSLLTPHIQRYCVSSRSFLFPLTLDTELTLHLSPIQLRHYSCDSSHRKMLGVLVLSCAIACLLWFLATPFRTGLWSISGPWWRRYTGEIEVFIRCFKSLMFH